MSASDAVRQRRAEQPGRASRDFHPAKSSAAAARQTSRTATNKGGVEIPIDAPSADIVVGDRTVRLTNLGKIFWPDEKISKGELIRYYAQVAPVLLPHLKDRAMVMKRYPHGAFGEFFFMKRAPVPRPVWIQTCSIEHESGNIIDFPVVQDLPTLLWLINLGCIDLNPWYARCDDVDRPDFLHFDLDPVTPAPGRKDVPFSRVLEVALIVRDTLDHLGIPSYPKTTGS